ncbi:hypothetical protein OKW21_004461 [Catalinimonas alkaloidigena]|uniref:hypothetical protein n=1 Tax=Catalinimonas alkaloidigena TaxID=1075417 RepID=UPI002404D2B5|nr:hypothetical protein [Catalinimonas alkaloidigena]MDF9799198.1 hypothetical protein [Catalinimonas alkaloidigena]
MEYNHCINKRYNNLYFDEAIRNIKYGLIQAEFDTINEYVLDEYFYQLIEEKVGRSLVLAADKSKLSEISDLTPSSCNVILIEVVNMQFIDITLIDLTALASMSDPKATMPKNDMRKRQFKTILNYV